MVIKFGELFQENITRKKIKPSDDVVFIGMQDVDENATIKEYSVTKYSELKSGFTYFEKNDVLVAKITPCFENGKGGFADSIPTDIGFGSTEFHILRAADSADPRYIYFQTKRPKLRLALEGEMVGSAGHRRVPFAALQNYELEYRHSKAEQTTIANALSDVDNLIAALETLITKKSAIKTAAMQQLLTGKKRLPAFAGKSEKESESASGKMADSRGETQTAKPSSEFETSSNHNTDAANTNNQQIAPRPGYKHTELGEIPEDWEVKALGCIGESIIGLTYSPSDVADFGSLVLRSSNVQKNRLAFENNVFVNMDLPDRVIVRKGDILICVRNGSRQLIGKCALIDEKAAGSAFGAFMSIYRTEFSKFVFFQFQSNIIQNQINEVMGATINQITNKDMAGFKIPLPKTKEEQTAIANVLSDMDTELDALQQRLSKTQKIKQGMMQELLTGKTRLVK